MAPRRRQTLAAAAAAAEADKAAAVAAALAKAETDKAAAAEELASLEVKYDTVVAKNQTLVYEKTMRACTVIKERFAMKHVSCSSEARFPFLYRLGF